MSFINNSTTVPCTIFAYLVPYVTTPTNRTEALEKPQSWYKELAPQGSGGAICKKNLKYRSSHVVGVTPAQFLTEDDYAGTYSSSPALGPKVIFGGFGLGGNCSLYVDVVLIMHSVLFDRGNETSS